MNKAHSISLNTADKFWTPKGLGAVGMDPYRAISELVANSLDWRRHDSDKIVPIIKIRIGKGIVQVIDNGVGMTLAELQAAVSLSVANDRRRPNLRVRKGMFGMGMKVACLSLGWNINITTRSISNQSSDLILNLNTRLFDHEEDIERHKNVEVIEKSRDNSNELNGWSSGTVISITDLNNRYLKPIDVRDALQEVFRPEIGVEGVQIVTEDIDNEKVYECQQIPIPLLDQFTINLDELNLYVDDKGTRKQIKGWLGLMRTAGSGSGKWGLHLFKDNQVIERFHQLPIRLGGLMTKNPHPQYARTFGEVHLDMCSPNFHKVGFDYTTDNWHQVQQLLKDHIDVIMKSSYDYKANDDEKSHLALKRLLQHKKVTSEAIKKLQNDEYSEPDEEDPKLPNEPGTPPDNEEDNFIPNGAIVLPTGEWFVIVEPITESFGSNSQLKPWRYHYREKSHELVIIINKDSAIYENYILPSFHDNILKIVMNWAISDCLMLFLHERFNYDIIKATAFRDLQLLKLFSNLEEPK